jgi:hypothetical protein
MVAEKAASTQMMSLGPPRIAASRNTTAKPDALCVYPPVVEQEPCGYLDRSEEHSRRTRLASGWFIQHLLRFVRRQILRAMQPFRFSFLF